MKILSGIVYLFLFSSCTFAQLDTNDYFPMHVGDKWVYRQNMDAYVINITGDTLMPNGNKYFVFVYSYPNNNYSELLRMREDGFVVIYNPIRNIELKWLNVNATKGEMWKYDSTDTITTFGWGVFDTGIYFESLVSKNLSYKIFSCGDLSDTAWCVETPDRDGIKLAKGLGSVGYLFSSLEGAYINGVGYGAVSVNENENLLPSHFSLSQNYPNPFNPETVIRFTLPVAGYTKGVVYDVLGKEMATLLNGDMSAGNHEIKFNAIDLSSGVYFFRLESGNFSSAIKMVVGK